MPLRPLASFLWAERQARAGRPGWLVASERLSPGPHGRPEAPAPESQAAAVTLEESVSLDRWAQRGSDNFRSRDK